MYLLAAQIGNNTPNESSLLFVGVVACIASLALLLWKRDGKAAA